ncbi:alpha/beta fold hydrolase [Piscinibacter sakaiensis]|uniref:alpha/beta fold hydrolase n=1 Tax=Piscinibacter sakaiensis TaxID=1547922 RepID=UPI003AAF2CAD
MVVMLHGGLDCTSTWKDLPEAIAAATGLGVLSYDRWGYGGSEELNKVPRERTYRFEESGPVFSQLLRHFDIRDAALFGHSDGGAMALLAAAAHPEVVRAVCACSPTIALDLHMVRAMAGARDAFEKGGLRERLMRHHGDKTDSMFWAWYLPWSSDDAVHWSMTAQLAAVRCPVTAVFGQADDYGWRPSARALVDHGSMALEVCALPEVGHDPQHKARGVVLNALQRVLARASTTG